jgi:hypothetical protein
MAPITVEPNSAAPAAAAPVEPNPGVEPQAAPAETGGAKLPDEVLQIPAMQALFAGAPAAFSASLKEFQNRPEAKLIASNKDALQQAGMGLYRSLGGDLGVLFNQLKISGEQLKAADQAGKLLELAPPFDVVNQQVAGSGENNPVLSAQPSAGAAGNTPAAANQMNSPVRSPAPLSAGAQKSLTNARIKNQTLGRPVDGPKPGQGRLLNNILKQPI